MIDLKKLKGKQVNACQRTYPSMTLFSFQSLSTFPKLDFQILTNTNVFSSFSLYFYNLPQISLALSSLSLWTHTRTKVIIVPFILTFTLSN